MNEDISISNFLCVYAGSKPKLIKMPQMSRKLKWSYEEKGHVRINI